MIFVGVIVSFVWLAFLFFVVYLSGESAFEMTLNEWGDFLAGGFAPLAFMWLVVGYFQQGKELKLSRSALVLQVEELRNSVEQQRALVEATQEDIAFAKAESERVREVNKKLAQPSFVLHNADLYSLNEAAAIIDVYIINYGSDIKNVTIDVVENDLYKSRDNFRYASKKWEHEEIVTVSVVCNEKDLSKIELLQFNVVYIDGLVERNAACIWVDVRDGHVVGLNMQPVKMV